MTDDDYILKIKGANILVDKVFLPMLSKYHWNFNGEYATTKIKGKTAYMHRLILGTPIGYETDHINRNTLDNRIINLRIVPTRSNSINRPAPKHNKSGYKGVSLAWIRARDNGKKWVAGIMVNRKRLYLGYFDDIKDAALAYNNAAVKYFGEYAYLNTI